MSRGNEPESGAPSLDAAPLEFSGREVLCVTTCEIYVPLPDMDSLGQPGTLERNQRGSLGRNRGTGGRGQKVERVLYPQKGLCDLYLLSSDQNKMPNTDCSSAQHGIKLCLILNNIIKETLRVFVRNSSWFELWTCIGDKKRNTTVKLCVDDDRWEGFSKQLTAVILTITECLKSKGTLNQVFELVAFQSKKTGHSPQNTEINRSENRGLSQGSDKQRGRDSSGGDETVPSLQSQGESPRGDLSDQSDKETGSDVFLKPKESSESQSNTSPVRQTESAIAVGNPASEALEPPFSPAKFQLPDTKSKYFGKAYVQSSEQEFPICDLGKAIRLDKSIPTAKYLEDLQRKHVPSPKSLIQDVNKDSLIKTDSLISNQSDYEDMMEQDKVIQRLVELLQAAINSNDKEAAAKHAGSLATTAAKVTLTLDPNSLKNVKDTEFSIKVYVEDREASGGCITLNVKPSDTVRDLKLRMCLKHSFPVEVQKWIIGKRIPPDTETLQKARVTPGQAVYLYLISPKSVGLTKEKFMEDRERMLHNQYPGAQPDKQGPKTFAESGPYIPMVAPATPQTPLSTQPPSRQRSEPYSSSSTGGGMMTPGAVPQSHLQQQKSRESQGNKRTPQLVTEKSLEEFEVIPPNTVFTPQPQPHKQETKIQASAGWVCPACTYINQPTRPGCEICATNRPLNYQVPEGYRMTKEEEERIRREREQEEQTQRASLNRGPERGPRENAEQDIYHGIPVNEMAGFLELNDNLNRENRAARNRSPIENALPIPHGGPHLLGTGEAPRGSLDNLHFPLDDRHIDWSEDNI